MTGDRGTPAFTARGYRVALNALSERDVHRALDVIAAAGSALGREPFGIEIVDALVDAIPADTAAYVEWRIGQPDELRVSRHELSACVLDAVTATCTSYPLRDLDHASCTTPLKITDVVSRLAFRRSAFYAAAMRPRGLEHQIKVWLPAPRPEARYFEFERAPGRDFDERDRAFLSLLRPHIAKLRARWERKALVTSLTERELDVLKLVAQGLTNRQVARRLFISPATVRTHLEHTYEKLGVTTRTAAVTAAFRIAS
jgi:DNA-binding CsgD family transcriptional regulator